MNDLQYVNNNKDDEYGILELQDKILEIMVYIDRFCSKFNIDYCLMAGSALGAKRHHGFIPWDDDIDIYMTEDGYAQFKESFIRYGDRNKYYLQEWGVCDHNDCHMITMAKIRMNNSEIQEKSYLGWSMHQGIFVDIFILHNCANHYLNQKLQYLCSEAVVLKGLEIRGYKAKNAIDALLLAVSRFLPKNLVLKLGLSYAYKYKNKDTEYYHGFIDTRSFSRSVFPKEIMFPGKYVDFENVKLKVPADNDKYLEIQYGSDYMIVPPVEKREVQKHTNGWKIDDGIVYNNFSDEERLI